MDELRVYRDIQMRTGGEIYIGVVGPVRTGKSTFIKRFMDLMGFRELIMFMNGNRPGMNCLRVRQGGRL